MKRITWFLLAVLLCACAVNAGACTSFAVYTSSPVYGMNWDYPDTAAYLRINQVEEYHRVFSFGFETEYGMATNGSMNDQGFAAFIQYEYPLQAPDTEADEESVVDLHDLANWTPYLFSKVQQVQDALDDGMRVVNKYYSLHGLFADESDEAFVLEELDGESILTLQEGGVLVMTNFPNGQIDQVDFDKTENELMRSHGFVGVDRYKRVHEIIAANRDAFDVALAFEALKEAAQAGLYRTRFSGVYDPVKMEVYVALERDFDHIWKISVTEGTVEAFLGFGEDKLAFSYAELCQGDLGIPFETLMAYAN